MPDEQRESDGEAGERSPGAGGAAGPTEPREPGGPTAADAPAGSPGRAALKGAVLWGVVAALAFLVLAQGYHLLEFGTLPLTVVAVGTVAVFAVTTLLTYVAGP